MFASTTSIRTIIYQEPDKRIRADRTAIGTPVGAMPIPSHMIHIGKAIEQELAEQRRSAAWLAGQIFCDRSNVYRLFRKRSIDSELLMRISHVLNRDFFALYSEELRQLAHGE